jgi:hypothetical protein
MIKPSDEHSEPGTATAEDTDPQVIQDLQVTDGDADAVGGGLGGESSDGGHKDW